MFASKAAAAGYSPTTPPMKKYLPPVQRKTTPPAIQAGVQASIADVTAQYERFHATKVELGMLLHLKVRTRVFSHRTSWQTKTLTPTRIYIDLYRLAHRPTLGLVLETTFFQKWSYTCWDSQTSSFELFVTPKALKKKA